MIVGALRWIALAGVATVALVVARMVEPGRHALEADVWVLVLGSLALLVLAAELRRVIPGERESALEEALEPEPPEVRPIPELHRLERELTLAASSEFDLHIRLRPVLREIVSTRLEQRGLRLEPDSPKVRELLGDELTELTLADREPPSNRQAPGPGIEELERTVARLERL